MIQTQNNFFAELSLQYKRTEISKVKIKSSKDVYAFLLDVFPNNTLSYSESFCVSFFNNSNVCLGYSFLFNGGQTGTVADVRIIFAMALQVGATSLVLSHNHPSGNITPSQADIRLTEKVKQAGKVLDIQVLDHVILTEFNGYYSFADEGKI